MWSRANLLRALRYSVADGIPARSLRVAVIVGTALNLINQGDAIFGDRPINWLKLGLTFAMPYVVSTYGAVAYLMANRVSQPIDTLSG